MAAHINLVLEEGFEPTRPKTLDPKSSAYTNFATPAYIFKELGEADGSRTHDLLVDSQMS